MNEQRVNCYQCKYFHVTWDPNFPKGCKAFEFKTKMLPSVEVRKASGQPCLRFAQK